MKDRQHIDEESYSENNRENEDEGEEGKEEENFENTKVFNKVVVNLNQDSDEEDVRMSR